MQGIVVTAEQLEQIKKKGLYILKEFDRVCRENNLRYSLIYGTLLGAVRHGGFIPWDDDVDVCMLREDYEKLRRIAPKALPKNLFYQCHETDKEYFQLFDKIRMNDTVFKEKYYTKYHMHHGDATEFVSVLSNWLDDEILGLGPTHGRKKVCFSYTGKALFDFPNGLFVCKGRRKSNDIRQRKDGRGIYFCG